MTEGMDGGVLYFPILFSFILFFHFSLFVYFSIRFFFILYFLFCIFFSILLHVLSNNFYCVNPIQTFITSEKGFHLMIKWYIITLFIWNVVWYHTASTRSRSHIIFAAGRLKNQNPSLFIFYQQNNFCIVHICWKLSWIHWTQSKVPSTIQARSST